MMTGDVRRVLVLGGTGWLGREVARAAVESGAEVVCLARGESGSVADGTELERADRLQPRAYDAVTGDWDEVVELAHAPDLVGPALDALADRAAHWTLVSTVSVYADDAEPDADESAALVEPDDLSEYGAAKVAAERATRARLGDRLAIVRPGLIVGPGDPSDRFGYWSARLSRPGPVLVPVLAERSVQVIDVTDLAAWIVHAGMTGFVGTVNAVGAPQPLGDVLRQVAALAGYTGRFVEADDDALVAHDVQYWAGPRSLPLWLPTSAAGFARRSGAAFRAAGGRTRPLQETLRRVLEDERARGVERPRRSGLSPADERAVLVALGATGA